MSDPQFSRPRARPPDPDGSGGCPNEPHEQSHDKATDALWLYLRRIESGLDHIDSRIDRLYIALGGGTVLLAAIGLGSAFIVRGG